LGLSLALMGRSAGGEIAQAERRPNLVILLADDLGYGDLSLQGNKEIATPHIDSLAAQGVRCTDGYVSGPYCSPTRAGLLTGRYQQRFGHEFNPALLSRGGTGQGLPVEERTLADRLRDVGYATALVGKWHLGEEESFHPLRRGFGEFFGFLPGAHSFFQADDPNYGPVLRARRPVELDGYLTDMLAREAVGFMERHQDQPFFLYLAFNAVHTPMEAPKALVDRFSQISDPRRRTYLAMLQALDNAVGQVLEALRRLDLERNTLVVFLSDNGGPTVKFSVNGSRNAPLRGSKGDTWEGGIRVPFLLRWPGTLPASTTYSRPVIQLDLTATALAAAGIAIDPAWGLDGVDLRPHLDGQRPHPPHDALFWRFGKQMAVRRDNWKLVRASLGTREYQDVPTEPMLFDLSRDVEEQHDLASRHPDRVRELQALWDRWNEQLPTPRWPATLKGVPLP
jgi:arylsulfatase A-like enzyme